MWNVFAKDKCVRMRKNRINKKVENGRNRYKIISEIQVECFQVNMQLRERMRMEWVIYIDGQRKG